MRCKTGYCIFIAFLCSCNSPDQPIIIKDPAAGKTQGIIPAPTPDSSEFVTTIPTGNTTPDELVTYAKTLTGIPYKYGSTNPAEGFDCSGFITYVFNHFEIAVPRRSMDFTYVHHEIPLNEAKTGDLVLFTGTDSTVREVGHMGIILATPGHELAFIHSTSGKAKGVTETPLNSYYMGRYVKTVRIFAQNER